MTPLTAGELRSLCCTSPREQLRRALAAFRPDPGVSTACTLGNRPVHAQAVAMDAFEHGTLAHNTRERVLRFHTADGATDAADSTEARHVLTTLDGLSADGWELLGPPTVSTIDGVTTTSYLLRRPQGYRPDALRPRRIR